MVGVNVRHNVQWMGATPLWSQQSTAGMQVAKSADEVAFVPSILRFANDNFMEEMLGVLNQSPRQLSDYLAIPETWRNPMTRAQQQPLPENETGISKLLNRAHSQAQQLKENPTQSEFKNQLVKRATPPPNNISASDHNSMLKLYQPAHQRYYLVSAALVKNEFGLPDQKVELTNQEKVSFVVRRVTPPDNLEVNDESVPDSSWTEHAFVQTSRGNAWKKITNYSETGSYLVSGEEQLAMFPTNYGDTCCDRMLYNGFIPVGKRETWMAAPSDNGAATLADQLTESGVMDSLAKAMLVIEVTEPWRAIINATANQSGSLNRSFANFEDEFGSSTSAKNSDKERAFNTQRDQIQTASWYILLDFASFLQAHLPNVWADVESLRSAYPGASLTPEQQLYNTFLSLTLSSSIKTKLRLINGDAASKYKDNMVQALKAIEAHRDDLEGIRRAFLHYQEHSAADVPVTNVGDPQWPDFFFPLTDPSCYEAGASSGLRSVISAIPLAGISEADTTRSEIDKLKLELLLDDIGNLLPKATANEQADIPLQTSQLDNRLGWFVIRCVYQRPNCGPLFPALVSKPTRFLQMAPFFDPEAPARPIRIPMPMDISPAGLRKYSRNTAFVLSDMLCGKVKGMRKYSLGDLVLSVLPWPFHKDLPDPGETGPCDNGGISFGMICSLSIPIVTLCAFILLIIMVTLFDLFFRWIPFLMICLPIPGLEGKSKNKVALST